VRWNGVELTATADGPLVPGERRTVLIRPESLTVAPAGAERTNTVKGQVDTVVYVGDHVDAWLDADGTPIRARLHPSTRLRRGQVVDLHADPSATVVLPAG
jgi:ABC-type Fe3+/spermidine/putrescine transport system ATPase subunit